VNNPQDLALEGYYPSYERSTIWQNVMIHKTVALSGAFLWIAAAIITWNKPATGYEASIYSSTPLIFWVANIINLIIGISFVIQQGYVKSKADKSLYGITGISLIVLSFASVISLFIVRGYALFSQYDSLTHLGFINQILDSGHFSASNFYPISHIYIVEFALLFNVASDTFLKLIPFVFALFNVMYFYCLAQAVLPRRGQAILATVVWMAFLSQWYLDMTPNMLANFMFPLGFFLLIMGIKHRDIQWKILFGIFIFLIPLLHPLVAYVLAAIMVSIWVFQAFMKNKLKMRKSNSIFLLSAIFVLLIWSSVWVSSFNMYYDFVYDLTLTINNLGETNLNSLINQAQYAAGYNYNVLAGFLKIYGGPILVLLIAVAGILHLLRKKDKNRREYWILLPMAPMIMIAVFFVALYVTVTGFPPERLIIYILLFGTLFCGYYFYTILNKVENISRKFPLFASAILIPVIMVLFVNDGLKLYPSPYIYQNAMQVTGTELTGMHWFIFNKDTTVQQTSITVDTYRFGSLFLTPTEVAARSDMKFYTADLPEDLVLPYHFGYDQKQYLGQSYGSDTYMVLSQECEVMYTSIYPEMAKLRFQTTDFTKLQSDPSVNVLYSNGGLDVYYIKAVAPS
jgi:hypothetical protein